MIVSGAVTLFIHIEIEVDINIDTDICPHFGPSSVPGTSYVHNKSFLDERI